MTDSSDHILNKTWLNSIKVVQKIGYRDGVAESQDLAFQSSFDVGYKLGFDFGLQNGYEDAENRFLSGGLSKKYLDQRNINCIICLNKTTPKDNILDLYKSQKDKNNYN